MCAAGCSSSQGPTEFTVRKEVLELPQDQQKQIHDVLVAYYGEAGNPRWMIPAEGDGGSSSGSDGEPSGPKLEAKHDPEHLRRGMEIFNLRCAVCHGITGDGAGPAAPYFVPRPRDYRRGTFKFISTPRGSKPIDEDLVRIIRNGAKGTSMPSFRWLPDEELRAVIDYVKLLSHRGELEYRLGVLADAELDEGDQFEPALIVRTVKGIEQSWEQASQQVIQPLVPNPPMTDETVRMGAIAFQKQVCVKCHGPDGKGARRADIDPNNLPKDDWGHVDFAADLTSGMLHGGRRPVDIYRRVYAGINGTPMPSFEREFKDTPETVWYIVHFVESIVEGREFEIPEVPAEQANAEQPPAEKPPPDGDAPPPAPPQDENPAEPNSEAPPKS